MHICTLTALTTASCKAAWDLLSDPRLWHTWDVGIKQAQLITAFQQGSQGYLIRSNGSTTTFSVLSCKQGQSYTVAIVLEHGATLLITRSVQDTDEGTLVSQRTALGGSPVGQLKYATQMRLFRVQAEQQFEGLMRMMQDKPLLVSDHRAEPIASPRY